MRRNGSYSCQLIFSRSKIITDNLSQPRAELLTATKNAHTGEIIRRSLQSNHKGNLKITDGQVVLHRISNNQKPVKQWVQNRVVEIFRFTELSEWKFVSRQDMIADLGARRVNDLNLVNKDSTWINCYDWMKEDQKYFATKLIHQIGLENESLLALQKENILKYHNQGCNSETHTHGTDNTYLVNELNEYSKEVIRQTSHVPDEFGHCYSFSNYLLDPNSRRFTIVIRILGFILKFIKNLKRRSRKLPSDNEYKSEIKNILLTDEEIET